MVMYWKYVWHWFTSLPFWLAKALKFITGGGLVSLNREAVRKFSFIRSLLCRALFAVIKSQLNPIWLDRTQHCLYLDLSQTNNYLPEIFSPSTKEKLLELSFFPNEKLRKVIGTTLYNPIQMFHFTLKGRVWRLIAKTRRNDDKWMFVPLIFREEVCTLTANWQSVFTWLKSDGNLERKNPCNPYCILLKNCILLEVEITFSQDNQLKDFQIAQYKVIAL